MTSVAATLALGGCTIDPATARLIDQLFPGVDHDAVAKAASEAVATMLRTHSPARTTTEVPTPTERTDAEAASPDEADSADVQPTDDVVAVPEVGDDVPTDDVPTDDAPTDGVPTDEVEPLDDVSTDDVMARLFDELAEAATADPTAAAQEAPVEEAPAEEVPAADEASAEPDDSETTTEAVGKDGPAAADAKADAEETDETDGTCDEKGAKAAAGRASAPGQAVRDWAKSHKEHKHALQEEKAPTPSWQPPVTTQPAPVPAPAAPDPVPTAPAEAQLSAAATAFFDLINAERAAVGLAPLSANVALNDPALAQATAIQAAGDLFHQDLRPLLTLGFRTAGENVGYGPDVQTLHDAFVDSPGHYANIVNEAFTSIGIGVVLDSNGTIWVAMVFGG